MKPFDNDEVHGGAEFDTSRNRHREPVPDNKVPYRSPREPLRPIFGPGESASGISRRGRTPRRSYATPACLGRL